MSVTTPLMSNVLENVDGPVAVMNSVTILVPIDLLYSVSSTLRVVTTPRLPLASLNWKKLMKPWLVTSRSLIVEIPLMLRLRPVISS